MTRRPALSGLLILVVAAVVLAFVTYLVVWASGGAK